jgi:hypothetical protein
VEVGNIKGFETAVPSQDKNKLYLNKKLGKITTAESFYKFSYDNLIQRARTIDVVWFNKRKMPNAFLK